MRCRDVERLNRLIQRCPYVRGTRHVASEGQRLPAEFFNRAGRFLVALFGHVGDHHAGARACERQRRSAADSAVRTGHERNLARKARRSHPLFLFVGSTSGSWAKEDLDRSPLIHRLVTLGGLLERQFEVKDLAWVDHAVPDQVHELG
jgi:hypothetical protein